MNPPDNTNPNPQAVSENQPITPETPAKPTTPPSPQSILSQPSPSVLEPSTPTESPPSRKFKVLAFISAFLVVPLILLLAGTYLVAYEKIKLAKYPELQKRVANFVMNLPFTPKTPKFLIERTALAHSKVTKQSFDASFSIASQDISGVLGLGRFDLQVKGALDYTNSKNVVFFANASVTKDFNVEFKKNDNKTLYFKLNKVPPLLLSFLGLDSEILAPIMGKWISYDITPLETDAAKQIEDKEVKREETLFDLLEKILTPEVVEKLKVTEVTEDGATVYKITLSADPGIIDSIGKALSEAPSFHQTQPYDPQKLSETIKNLTLEIFIDKKTFYTRKTVVSTEIEFDQAGIEGVPLLPIGSGTSKVVVAAVLKSGNFGEEVKVETPNPVLSQEELNIILTEMFKKVYGDALAPN